MGLSDGGDGKIKVAVRIQGAIAGAVHIDKTVSVRSSVTVEHNRVQVHADSLPVIGGRLTLGTWQQLVLIDFDDRPRDRTVIVQVVS